MHLLTKPTIPLLLHSRWMQMTISWPTKHSERVTIQIFTGIIPLNSTTKHTSCRYQWGPITNWLTFPIMYRGMPGLLYSQPLYCLPNRSFYPQTGAAIFRIPHCWTALIWTPVLKHISPLTKAATRYSWVRNTACSFFQPTPKCIPSKRDCRTLELNLV